MATLDASLQQPSPPCLQRGDATAPAARVRVSSSAIPAPSASPLHNAPLVPTMGFMATLEITEQNLRETIEGNSIVILDFWAGWCQPCQRFAPIFEAAAEKHTDIVFGKVDTDAQGTLATALNIRSIPTLIALRDQVVVFRDSGALPEAAFEQLISQIRALDMDAVKAQLAAQEKGKSQDAGTSAS
jgi:thioredoxin